MPSTQFRKQLLEDARMVMHFTNNWLLFGSVGFAFFCSAVAAAKGLFANS